uniref:Uncharacterized protein n=1 Tax=Arundo donax TaxID=35708 RepID=A0A0A9B6W0_ARUDO
MIGHRSKASFQKSIIFSILSLSTHFTKAMSPFRKVAKHSP